MNKLNYFVILTLVFSSGFNFVLAERELNETSAGDKPYIDPKIYETLNNSRYARSFLTFNSEIDLKTFADSLDPNDFELKVIRVSKRFIVVDITSEGLARIADDTRIASIYLDISVSATGQEGTNNTYEVSEGNNFKYVVLGIILAIIILLIIILLRKSKRGKNK